MIKSADYPVNPKRPSTNKPYEHSFGLAALLITILVILSMLTRIALLIKSASAVDFTFINLFGIFGIGLFYDLVNAVYFILPFMVYIWLMSDKALKKNWQRILLYGIFSFFIFGLLFNTVSEWFFWDEFSARFNFIAVDYLVYTNEVIGNIRQSYPVELIIIFLVLVTAGFVYFLKPLIRKAAGSALTFKSRSIWMLGYLLILAASFFLVSNKTRQFSENTYVNELAGNGLYELFAAYRNNELDYAQFYQKIPDAEAFKTIREKIKTPESHFVDNNPFSIERKIINPGIEKKMNVVLISVESLSADFLGIFGNTQKITPNLDSLATHSLLFTHLYATGTRTVRGLEALSVGTPPTPGQSIVRRPKNEGLFSMGRVFKEKGYESKFIYGGYGYFDNMGYFFKNNDYEVVDRKAIAKKDIDYENIWGVADENLFTLATREIEKTIKAGKPVFAHIMTTSNHRPFTYPNGRIDIPSHTSREGAVKYTDYAIGRFIKEAKTKPWFKNTLFVIVADHCASSAGKADLPVNKYLIPLLIYSPGNIQPAKMERLMSQIDLGPTILGLLNFSYTSKFFGYDIFKLEEGRERAFISTYQSLGYLRKDTLIILKPQRIAESFLPDFKDGTAKETPVNKSLTKEAITWYQTASFQFKNKLMK
ncbi:LTA synthase family protein [Dyadobacter frigoris]|uniref:LTA synthase family protein n=1 Tax=Dyadobacter frigoris TaxID=2576211 RepID=A0A4U6D600_9BACT|nr:alkaline phosphatase family protein [Dyadobacter frigoris]TKT91637.1 LTA synthase family protein [Dyadobacter frigoris]GLU51799.1 sulfatase [Dyadobacter frigoris]